MTPNIHSHPWVPDQGDGTYRNPVLHADYSDPDVIRVGGDFYLTASSFNCIPGLPILHSRDLVNWRLVSHALRELPHPRYAEVQPGQGVWAPAMRYHDRRFWIVFPTPDEGIYVTTAEHPEGSWSEPHLLLAGKGLIDPCPLWDDDGRAYLVHAYAFSRSGIRNRLHVRPMSPDAREILGEGEVVVAMDPRLPPVEGPKFHKRNGWYYLSAPAGGVPAGWQSVFRSRDVYGPYEEKIVLAQRGTPVNGPHQGALVDSPSGDWWFVHFQEKQPYGRIVHLQPVLWEDDWPLIGVDQDDQGVGRPVERFRMPVRAEGDPVVPADSDDFDAAKLGLQWQWQGNVEGRWYSLSARPGQLRLYSFESPAGDLKRAPNLLLQKFPAEEFAVTTRLEMAVIDGGIRAGLVVMGKSWAALEVSRGAAGECLIRQIRETGDMGEFVCPVAAPALKLRVEAGGRCRFGVEVEDCSFYQIGPEFQAVPGTWIGAKVGLYSTTGGDGATGGYADFEYFRVTACHATSDGSIYRTGTLQRNPSRSGGLPASAAGR